MTELKRDASAAAEVPAGCASGPHYAFVRVSDGVQVPELLNDAVEPAVLQKTDVQLRLTYYWYKFIAQPAIKNHYGDRDLTSLQKAIEAFHGAWETNAGNSANSYFPSGLNRTAHGDFSTDTRSIDRRAWRLGRWSGRPAVWRWGMCPL